MSILISILLGLLCVLFRKSKFVTILGFVFLWSLWSFNSWNGDYDGYEKIYNDVFYQNTSSTVVERGYFLINNFFYSMGFTFQSFLKIVSAFILLIVLIVTLKVNKYPALYLFFYYFIFIMEFVFIRNYICDTLLLLGFYLAYKEIKYYKIWLLGIIFICCIIHYTSILFLLFLIPIFKKEIFSIYKSLIYAVVLLIISVFTLQFILPFLGAQYLTRLDLYGSDSYYKIIIAHLIFVLSADRIYRFIYFKENGVDEFWNRVIRININLNIVSLAYLSLYIHVPYFSRVFKFLFAINFIALLSICFFVKKRLTIEKIFIPYLAIILVFIFYYLNTNFEFTLVPLYEHNLLWK